MKAKHLQLLRCLSEQNDWMNASSLSAKLNVSLRSVKNYVADISVLEPALILSSRQGYLVDQEKVHKVFTGIDSGIPQTPDERINYIIHKLVKEAHDSRDHTQLNIYDLSEEICVSSATLKVDIQKAKRRCSEYDLVLQSNGDFITLDGLEKNKRKILSSIMFNETKETFMNIETIQNAFMDYDISYTQEMIADTLKKRHYFINDYSLMNLVLHVTIAVDRMTNNVVYTGECQPMEIKSHEYELAREIAQNLEAHYHIKYNENEIYELSLLLISSATNLDYNTVTPLDLETTVGTDVIELTKKLMLNFTAFYYLDLNDAEFMTRFTLHIKNLLIRANNQHFSRNPLTESIKGSCPFIYECAVSISNDIKEYTGYTINDDEIAYIAFHIGGALENQKNIDNKVSCIVLFPQYYDMDLMVMEKLNTDFQDRILVKNVITKEQDLEGKQADLIISTIQIRTYTPIPYLMITPFMNNHDRSAIFHKLDEVAGMKKNQIFKDHLKAIFHPDFFERSNRYQDEHETITHMCEVMHDHGYVNEHFIEEVFEREKMSSTAFNNIAVPHSMKMRADKTGMYVIISEKGIRWGKNIVNIVLLLSISMNERKVFHEMFDSLTTILTNDLNLRKVMQSDSYEEFIDTIINCN